MPMYNLTEYSDNYAKRSGSLCQYCKDIPAVNNNDNIVGFNGANATDSFNSKAKITGQTDDDGKLYNAEIMLPLKYLGIFWRTFEMPLTLFRMGFSGAAHRWGGVGAKMSHSLKSVTHILQ